MLDPAGGGEFHVGLRTGVRGSLEGLRSAGLMLDLLVDLHTRSKGGGW